MATGGRRAFLRQALRCFARQTWPNRELIVADDSVPDCFALCRNMPGVRYLRLPRPTLMGTKLNLAAEASRGSILQKLDDDDYYHPDFLASSVEKLTEDPGVLTTRCCFLVLLPGDLTLRHSGHAWKPGGTLCFRREMWQKKPFRDIRRSVDSWFLRDHRPRIHRICRVEEYILVRHGANTWNELPSGDVNSYFRESPVYPKPLSAIVPPRDLRFYEALARLALIHEARSSIESFHAPRP